MKKLFADPKWPPPTEKGGTKPEPVSDDEISDDEERSAASAEVAPEIKKFSRNCWHNYKAEELPDGMKIVHWVQSLCGQFMTEVLSGRDWGSKPEERALNFERFMLGSTPTAFALCQVRNQGVNVFSSSIPAVENYRKSVAWYSTSMKRLNDLFAKTKKLSGKGKKQPMEEWAGRRALQESKSGINMIVESLRDGGLSKSRVLRDNSVRELITALGYEAPPLPVVEIQDTTNSREERSHTPDTNEESKDQHQEKLNEDDHHDEQAKLSVPGSASLMSQQTDGDISPSIETGKELGELNNNHLASSKVIVQEFSPLNTPELILPAHVPQSARSQASLTESQSQSPLSSVRTQSPQKSQQKKRARGILPELAPTPSSNKKRKGGSDHRAMFDGPPKAKKRVVKPVVKLNSQSSQEKDVTKNLFPGTSRSTAGSDESELLEQVTKGQHTSLFGKKRVLVDVTNSSEPPAKRPSIKLDKPRPNFVNLSNHHAVLRTEKMRYGREVRNLVNERQLVQYIPNDVIRYRCLLATCQHDTKWFKTKTALFAHYATVRFRPCLHCETLDEAFLTYRHALFRYEKDQKNDQKGKELKEKRLLFTKAVSSHFTQNLNRVGNEEIPLSTLGCINFYDQLLAQLQLPD